MLPEETKRKKRENYKEIEKETTISPKSEVGGRINAKKPETDSSKWEPLKRHNPRSLLNRAARKAAIKEGNYTGRDCGEVMEVIR